MEFKEFRDMQQRHVSKMLENHSTLFYVDICKDALWEAYLDAFPEGTNEVFRERREFDCSCCKQFVRQFGNVVVVENNRLVSIWDFEVNDPKFGVMTQKMARLVRSASIAGVFVTDQTKFGTDYSHEQLQDGTTRGATLGWKSRPASRK
jgi:hypothetical protein